MNVTIVFNATLNGSNNSNFFLDDVAITSDLVLNNGGGIYNHKSAPTLINVTFSGNIASSGGGIYNHSSSPILSNCTFSGNSVSESGIGGGMLNEFSSSPTLTNLVLWGDTPDEISNSGSSSIPIVTFSDVQGGYDGTGNIDADPLFMDATNGDYHLSPDSPCIEVGSNDVPNLPVYDFEGDERILDGDGDGVATVDMGVDEYKPIFTVTTIRSDDPDPSWAGQLFTVTFEVTSTLEVPTGVVTLTVRDSPVSCSTVLVDGLGSCQLTLNKPGDYTLSAAYVGTPDILPSNDTEMHTVIDYYWRYLALVVK
jgi:hypothetical protein